MRTLLSLTLLVPVLLLSGAAEPSSSDDDPMAAFAPLVGRWRAEDGGIHVYEWGVARKTVRARSHAIVAGEERLVGEAFWFWHPAAREIQGTAVVVGMPFEVLEMKGRFEDGALIQELRAIDAHGKVTPYRETFAFPRADVYEWSLFAVTPGGDQEIMNGTYTRQREEPGKRGAR